ncbi:MAG: hypothetical protein HY075_01040 [Deltaproteobacteria bacterium]|nr:hypothetical protein [Deltaproteobacteria bacterium]
MDNNVINHVFEFLLYQPAGFPYLAAFSMLLACGLGLPIPEDLTLFTMGYVAYSGIASFRASCAVCLFGVLVGDATIYWIGRRYGTRLLKKGILAKLFPPERMAARPVGMRVNQPENDDPTLIEETRGPLQHGLL